MRIYNCVNWNIHIGRHIASITELSLVIFDNRRRCGCTKQIWFPSWGSELQAFACKHRTILQAQLTAWFMGHHLLVHITHPLADPKWKISVVSLGDRSWRNPKIDSGTDNMNQENPFISLNLCFFHENDNYCNASWNLGFGDELIPVHQLSWYFLQISGVNFFYYSIKCQTGRHGAKLSWNSYSGSTRRLIGITIASSVGWMCRYFIYTAANNIVSW